MATKSIFNSQLRRHRKRREAQSQINAKSDTTKSILLNFCSYTSWGGLGRVAESKHAALKIIWLLAFITAFGAGIHQLIGLFYTYKSRPISTHMSLENGVVFAFPSVTVCNFNILRKSRIKSLPPEIRDKIERYAKARNASNSAQEKPVEFHHESLQHLKHTDEEYKIIEETAMLLAGQDESTLKPHGHQIENLILSCKYQGLHCRSHSYWSTFWHYKFGNCFIFNPNRKDLESLTTAKSGPSHGLVLELDIEQHEYIDQLTQDAGAIAHISPRGKTPFPYKEGVSLAPGFSISQGLRMVQTIRVDRFGNNSCVADNTTEEETIYTKKFNASYSKMACMESCIARNQRKYCGCMEYKYQPQDNSMVCNMFDFTTVNCLRKVLIMAKEDQLNCSTKCPPSCSEQLYKLTPSFSSFPSENYMQSFFARSKANMTAVDLRKNLIKLQIFYQDLNYDLIEEHISYKMENFVSDIGGQLGLWLGVSVLSGLEIIDLIILLLLHFGKSTKINNESKVQVVKIGDEERSGPPTLMTNNFLAHGNL